MSRALGLLFALWLTVIAAWVATGLVRRHALRNAMLDIPNSRSSHAVPTARGGGLAIVLIFLPCVLLLFYVGMLDLNTTAALVAGGGSIAIVGYLDDRNALPASIRFGVHLGASVWVVVLLGGITENSLRGIGLQGIFAGSVIAVLGLSWMTNLFNFMDGIDGVAACEDGVHRFRGCVAHLAAWRRSRPGNRSAPSIRRNCRFPDLELAARANIFG